MANADRENITAARLGRNLDTGKHAHQPSRQASSVTMTCRAAHPEAAIGEFCDGDDVLDVGNTDAGDDFAAAGIRPQRIARDHRPWIAFSEYGDPPHMIGGGHRTVDGDAQGH